MSKKLNPLSKGIYNTYSFGIENIFAITSIIFGTFTNSHSHFPSPCKTANDNSLTILALKADTYMDVLVINMYIHYHIHNV